ncbi:MAG TPA: OB-fold nucleic acid binding domain-containing protein, partial [Anaerolineales bacterium]|nr:OB-fold nucleic acid binding domain-containing protein [Anaerolineales bacterium]
MREYSDLEQIRIAKLERLTAAGLEAYPTRAERTHTSAQALADYQSAAPTDSHAPHGEYTVTGRVRAIRVMGKSAFAHIEDGDGRIQLYLKINDVGAAAYQLFVDAFDLGDFIQASGGLFKTKTGEVTLWVKSFRMLAKAISPLPAAKEEVVDG